MADRQTRIAVIGLGVMGLPIACQLATEWTTYGFDPHPDRAASAAAAGVLTGLGPAAAAAEADVIVIAVRTAEQVERALFDTDGVVSGLRSGSLVVLTSTVGVESARGLVARLREVGAGLVDAPISGSPARAAAGDLLVLASGSTGALAMAMPVLERLARKVVVVGDAPGDGQAVKIVNQLLCGVHIAAAAEALKLADALGLDLEKTLAALGEGAAASFMLGERGERIIAALRTGRSDFRSRLDIFDKDMELVTDAAMTSRLELHLAEAARELYRVAEHTGLGAADDSNVVLAIGSRGSGDG